MRPTGKKAPISVLHRAISERWAPFSVPLGRRLWRRQEHLLNDLSILTMRYKIFRKHCRNLPRANGRRTTASASTLRSRCRSSARSRTRARHEAANAARGRAAASKLFSKPFQIWAVFLQAFPKKALAVLWDFKGLQGFQTQSVLFQIFCFLLGLEEPVARRPDQWGSLKAHRNTLAWMPFFRKKNRRLLF
jgi:hypothetical protein